MTDHAEIYRREADQYEYLVASEDYDGNLLPAIQRIFPLAGKEVIELGAPARDALPACWPRWPARYAPTTFLSPCWMWPCASWKTSA